MHARGEHLVDFSQLRLLALLLVAPRGCGSLRGTKCLPFSEKNNQIIFEGGVWAVFFLQNAFHFLEEELFFNTYYVHSMCMYVQTDVNAFSP